MSEPVCKNCSSTMEKHRCPHCDYVCHKAKGKCFTCDTLELSYENTRREILGNK